MRDDISIEEWEIDTLDEIIAGLERKLKLEKRITAELRQQVAYLKRNSASGTGSAIVAGTDSIPGKEGRGDG